MLNFIAFPGNIQKVQKNAFLSEIYLCLNVSEKKVLNKLRNVPLTWNCKHYFEGNLLLCDPKKFEMIGVGELTC